MSQIVHKACKDQWFMFAGKWVVTCNKTGDFVDDNVCMRCHSRRPITREESAEHKEYIRQIREQI